MKHAGLAAMIAAVLAGCAGVPEGLTEEEANAPKICRESEPTGSNIIKRECLTAKQWAIRDEEDRARNVGIYDNSKQNGNPATM